MPIQLIDYVQDAKIEDGSVFNEMLVRIVGDDILFDYAGLNPAAAKILDPKKQSGIADDEILIDEKFVNQETVNHELNEDRELKADPSLSLWEVHTALMTLAKTNQNLSINHVEVKTMPDKVIRKSVPLTIRKGADGRDEIVITTATPDRGGDRVFPEGGDFTNYNKNPVIMWLHDYKGSTPAAGIPIGKNSYFKTSKDGIVAGPPIFLDGDPFADRVKNAWDKGFIRTASIGFAPLEDPEQNEFGGYDYKKWEMLEWSLVPIPMNAEALRVAKDAGFIELIDKEVVTKPEETEDFFRIPVSGESGDKHKDHRIRTIDISAKDGISALYCGECKVVITYLFSKEKKYGWTMEKATKWVKEHEKSISQGAIRDELDYCLTLIRAWDFNEANQVLAKSIHTELIKRFPGSDMSVDIKSLTQANRALVGEAVELCNKAETLCNEHHKAHNSNHKDLVADITECRLRLQGLNPPEEPPEDEGNKLLRAFIAK